MPVPIPTTSSQPTTESQPTDPLTSQPTAPPSTSTSTTTSEPSNPSQLPPAALDLAAKLFDLARAGETATLAQYLSAGIPPNLTNHAGDTLLMLASYHGHLGTVRMLVEKGGDVNAINGRGQSPLAGTIFKGFDDVTRLLYEHGADIRAGQPSAADCAYMFRRRDTLRLFGLPIPDEQEPPQQQQQEWA